jgi:flagellar biosynthesis protein FliQ
MNWLSDELLPSLALLTLVGSGVFLVPCLIVGLVSAIFQAVTQIQDTSLSSVPKLAVICLTLYFLWNVMVGELSSFAGEIFSDAARYAAADLR